MRNGMKMGAALLGAILAGAAAPRVATELREVAAPLPYAAAFWEPVEGLSNGTVRAVRLFRIPDATADSKTGIVGTRSTALFDCGWGMNWEQPTGWQLIDAVGSVKGESFYESQSAPVPNKWNAAEFQYFCTNDPDRTEHRFGSIREAVRFSQEQLKLKPRADIPPPAPVLINPGPPVAIDNLKVWTLGNDVPGRRAMLMGWTSRPRAGERNPTAYLFTLVRLATAKRPTFIVARQVAFDCAKSSVSVRWSETWQEGVGRYPAMATRIDWTPDAGPFADALRQACAGQEPATGDVSSLTEALARYRATWAP